MADYVLDYSSGWPRTVAPNVGTVRYIGTPGRSKNLTPEEAAHRIAHGIPQALVYEATAGWMAGGGRAGIAAAQAAVADAARCGVQVRCVYFACDVDVTSSSQMAAVLACLDGAATVLGRARVGVYGEADVIDAAVPGHAAYGWQTRAWSRGRESSKACLLQEIGYVYPDGVEADRSTVLRPDWGQWPYGEDDMAITAEDIDTLVASPKFRLMIRNELITALADPTHQYLQDELAPIKAAEGSVLARLDGLAVGGGQVDLDALADLFVAKLIAKVTS